MTFQCNDCGAEFYISSDLRKHNQKEHPVEKKTKKKRRHVVGIRPCEECGMDVQVNTDFDKSRKHVTCSQVCRAKVYRKKNTIRQVEFAIKNNIVHKLNFSVKQLSELGFTVVLTKNIKTEDIKEAMESET